MSYCPNCGAFSPGDPETGADFDDLCPSCGEAGFEMTADGEILAPETEAEARERELVERR